MRCNQVKGAGLQDANGGYTYSSMYNKSPKFDQDNKGKYSIYMYVSVAWRRALTPVWACQRRCPCFSSSDTRLALPHIRL